LEIDMRFLVALAIAALCSTVLSADVTIRQSMTMEGQMAAMTAGKLPEMVTRIKGAKARTDIDVQGQTVSSIADLALKQMTILHTPTTVTPGSAAPKVDVSVKPTGQSKTIDGLSCDEYSVALTLDMASMIGSSQMPPEAAAMMKDVTIVANGSLWITKSGPGVDEYVAFQKAVVDSNLMSAMASLIPQGGLDKLMSAVAAAPGIPCLSEFTMTFEGTGQMVEVMKQMGPMKMVQKTTAISIDPVPESVFVVPGDYKVEKK
jgi:hypothetical protein